MHRDWDNESESPWVQYEWSEPVKIDKVESTGRWIVPVRGAPGSRWPRIHVPQSYRILYWNGNDFVPVNQPQGFGVAADTFNATTFEPVKTSKYVLKSSREGAACRNSRVARLQLGPVPALPPVIEAGVDRSVMLDAGPIWPEGDLARGSPKNSARWMKASGPGTVAFEDALAGHEGEVLRARRVRSHTGGVGHRRPLPLHRGARGSGAAQGTARRCLHPEILHRQSLLESARQGPHRGLDSALHPHVRANRYPAHAGRAESTTSSKPAKPIAANRTAGTRAMSSPMPGCIRPLNRCASR